MLMPSVSRYMSTPPCTIERTATLAEAHRMMRKHAIRHLPVLDQGQLCGIVSDRDLRLIESLTNVGLHTTLVQDAMTDHPCVVPADTALDEVAAIMGEHKYGSVVVMGREGVEGVFTAVDACRALAQVLQRATE